MKSAITLPDTGSPRVSFSLWYVRRGDRLAEGDRVAEVLIPGATFDVHAPAGGTLTEQLAFPNDPLVPGQLLGWIQE